MIRYPPEREAEAPKLFGTILASHRMNPVWQKAKDDFLTNLGNIEHAGRMERLRLMGEQSRAYARAQLFDPAVEFQQNWTKMQKRPD